MTHELDKMPGDRYERQQLRIGYIVRELKPFVCFKDKHYKSSWRKRGGSQAFAVISRKWDRFEAAAEDKGYDIFQVFANEDRQEGIADDCLDITGYMLVLIEHMMELNHITPEQLERLLHPLFKVNPTPSKSFNPNKPAPIPIQRGSGMDRPFGYDEGQDALPEEKPESRSISGFPVDEEY